EENSVGACPIARCGRRFPHARTHTAGIRVALSRRFRSLTVTAGRRLRDRRDCERRTHARRADSDMMKAAFHSSIAWYARAMLAASLIAACSDASPPPPSDFDEDAGPPAVDAAAPADGGTGSPADTGTLSGDGPTSAVVPVRRIPGLRSIT